MNNDVYDRAQDIIGKLKFIGKIKEGEIIDVQSLTLHPSGWITSVYRTIKNLFTKVESRDITLEFVNEALEEGLELANLYYSSCGDESFHKRIGNLLVQSLQESRKGISNLKSTYGNDAMYTARIEAMLSMLDAKLKNILDSENEKKITT